MTPKVRRKFTVTGLSTRWTFPSSMRISRAFAHNTFTSFSLMISHRFSCSICRSRSEYSLILDDEFHRESLEIEKHKNKFHFSSVFVLFDECAAMEIDVVIADG
jgi:hypothetical protein